MAILDAFHFDLSEATPLNEREQLQASLDTGGERKKLELGTEKHSQKLSKEEGEMEGGEEGEDREEGEEMDVEQKLVADNSRVKQALAQKIHKTIVSSILPSLQAVLTKRVRVYRF